MLQSINFLKVALGLLITLIVFTINVPTAWAHYPHDDIFAVEISPDYRQDHTLLINVRGNLLRSQDGGNSWQRIVNGLDNQHELSTLDIASASPKTIFLATLGDGIYKSENGGNSWFGVNQGLDNLKIAFVAIAPDASELVLAAGNETGLYRTENGGASWHSVMTDTKITAIAFAPQQSQVIIGDAKGNLYLSDNRGQNWQQLASLPNSGAISTIAISRQFALDGSFWVGTTGKGIWQTTDGGNTFTSVNKGIDDPAIMSLAIPNHEERTLLASTRHQGVFRSTDGGESWQKSSKGLTKDHQAGRSNFNRPHFSDLSISQTFSQDRTVFVAGFDGLFKSTDGGRVWQELNTLSSNIIVGFDISPDYQQDSTVAVTTYLGGAYLSSDGGDNWTAINNGLAKDGAIKRFAKQILQGNFVARSLGVAFSPNYSQDQSIFSPSWTYFLTSSDRGRHWQKNSLKNLPKPLNRPTKYSIAVSPNFAVDKTIYLGSMQDNGKDSVLISTNGGQNFTVAGNLDHKPVGYLAISPDFAADKTLYAAARDGVYKSVDAGQTWQSVGNNVPAIEETTGIAISPGYKEDRTVFVGTATGLIVTKDGGNTWKQVGSEAGYVEALAVSPNYQRDRTVIMNVKGKGLFKTVDGGTTFTRVGKDLWNDNHSLANMNGFWPPVVPIKFSPSYERDRTIYGVSGTELFRSSNGGDTWANLSLPTPREASLMQQITYYYHRSSVAPITKFLIAAIAASFCYLILKFLRLEKSLSLKSLPIKAGGAFAAFIVVFTLLNV